jgi:hypothetical protein
MPRAINGAQKSASHRAASHQIKVPRKRALSDD